MLDFRRVGLIDESGAVVLTQMAGRLQARGTRLLLAGVSGQNRLGRLLAQFAGDRFAVDHGAADVDQAVEDAELRLLAQTGVEPLHETVPIEQVSLLDGLDAAQRARLAACLQPRRLASGEVLFRLGDPADRLYVITADTVNVFSGEPPTSDTLPQRFVGLSPGMMLGEMAMLDGGGRTGDAVAFGETDVHSLDGPVLLQLRSDAPLLYAQIHRNIGLHLAQRLRAASSAWRASTR